MHRINLTLVNFLVFTIITSAVAYYLIVKTYDAFDSPDQVTADGYVK